MALYHSFLDKITVIKLLYEGNYSFTTVTLGFTSLQLYSV